MRDGEFRNAKKTVMWEEMAVGREIWKFYKFDFCELSFIGS